MQVGQYIRRAIGYYLKLLVLIGLIYLLLFATGTAAVSAELFFNEMFSTPRGALLLVALAALAACYPKFGYVKRTVPADLIADKEAIINAFHTARYVMIKEEAGHMMTFRASSVFRRLWMTFDDKVTVTAIDGGIVLEGIRKETVHAEFRINTFVQNRRDEK